MKNQLLEKHNEFIKKQEILAQAAASLKKEFVGLDSIIDEVIEAMSSWYLFPDLQEKPVVVNLWGLTGVGKSALLQRLSELIHFDKKYYHFDLGEKGRKSWEVKNQLNEIYENANAYPILICLDEFQHARTINESGSETEKSESRVIWQLLDSGKFQISRNNYLVGDIYDLIYKLKLIMRKGVKVVNGKVVENKLVFQKEMSYMIDPFSGAPQHSFKEKDTKPVEDEFYFVPEQLYETIYSLDKKKYISTFEVQLQLSKLNGNETIEYLFKVIENANSPKTIDCSKSLIFVVGNLDEAYSMSHNFNPDMDADEFHEQSLKINVPIIKSALRNRFRSEQIARLGNMHIIYPAFSRDSFEKIIKMELSKIAKWIFDLQHITLEFDPSILDLIYREGVYPTQGTRPLFTTIHQIVNSKLARVSVEMIVKKLYDAKVIFKAISSGILIEYHKEGKLLHSMEVPQLFSLEKLRENKRDDLQAITAVHESGHAILSSILMKTVPEVIFSNTAEINNAGFVYTKFKWNYVSRKEIKSRLAIYLGGYAAEKLIFGSDNVTTGAEEDLENATHFITRMLKSSGMGAMQGAFDSKSQSTRFFLHDEENVINEEAKTCLNEAMLLAEKTLQEQEVLLLKMADYLSDNRVLRMQELKDMLANYAINFDMDSLVENGDLLFYRNHLKNKVLGGRSKRLIPVENSISWNKHK